MFIYSLGWYVCFVTLPFYVDYSKDDNDEDDDKLRNGLVHHINQQYAFFHTNQINQSEILLFKYTHTLLPHLSGSRSLSPYNSY